MLLWKETKSKALLTLETSVILVRRKQILKNQIIEDSKINHRLMAHIIETVEHF